MKSFRLIIFSLLTGLAGQVLAQDLALPSLEQRRGMSYEEYANLREKMRSRIDGMQQPAATHEQETAEQESAKKARGRYGEGYQARTQPEGKPDVGARPERPERPPRFERIDRGDMMRR